MIVQAHHLQISEEDFRTLLDERLKAFAEKRDENSKNKGGSLAGT